LFIHLHHDNKSIPESNLHVILKTETKPKVAKGPHQTVHAVNQEDHRAVQSGTAELAKKNTGSLKQE
jgi:hypothetical protein